LYESAKSNTLDLSET